MSGHGLHEPDKYASAVWAALLMVVAVVPLVWTVSFRKVVRAEPMVVAIVSQRPAPLVEIQPDPEPDIDRLKERIEESRRNQRAAEVARRREQQRAEEQEKEEQRRAEEERKRREAEEQARLEEERQEQERIRKAKEEEERKRREAEQERKRREEQARLAEEQRRAAVEARLKADRDQRLMDRYIAGVHDRVKRHLTNPEGVPTDIEVEISVPLQPDGRLADTPRIISSSGHEPFDEQAVRAIIQGAKNGFELPPDEHLRSQFNELILIIEPKQD